MAAGEHTTTTANCTYSKMHKDRFLDLKVNELNDCHLRDLHGTNSKMGGTLTICNPRR